MTLVSMSKFGKKLYVNGYCSRELVRKHTDIKEIEV